MDEVGLFQLKSFTAHSVNILPWKIECDALGLSDWECLAYMVAERVRPFVAVEGVPQGGLILAKCLNKYITRCSSLLIVDDVLTTGSSMEYQRNGRIAQGAVIFARRECPSWVTPIFQMGKG